MFGINNASDMTFGLNSWQAMESINNSPDCFLKYHEFYQGFRGNLAEAGLKDFAADLIVNAAIFGGGKALFSKLIPVIPDEAFVRFDPEWTTNSILENGIQSKYFSDGKVWFTKYKYVKDIIDSKQLGTILYRQNLWPNVIGKFDSGAVLYELKNIENPIFAGVTNKINGIPQWYIQSNILSQDIEIIKFLAGGN
jgi:hypothetical protein